jgi:hypothetical protein
MLKSDTVLKHFRATYSQNHGMKNLVQSNKFFSGNFFASKFGVFKSLIYKEYFFAPEVSKLWEAACCLAFPCVKALFSTKLSTVVVDRRKSTYKTGI